MPNSSQEKASFALLMITEDILFYGGLFYLLELNNRLSYPGLQVFVYSGYLLSLAFLKINIDYVQGKVRKLLIQNFCCLIISLAVALWCLFTLQTIENISLVFMIAFGTLALGLLLIAYRVTRNILKPVPGNNSPSFIWDEVSDLSDLLVRETPLSQTHHAASKRIFDIFVSSLFLMSIFPVIYLVLGIAIKCSSPGPVFFVQERTGKRGKTFKCYKFRSMHLNGEADTKQATANDPRTTHVGRFIRRTNLDEFPQFINVLKGDMSIVGPRPHPIPLNDKYCQVINKYMVRHFIKPGITGWAQINGFRGETKEVEEMEGRITKDIWYLENWTFRLDIQIILKTAINMFRGEKNAY
jgi:lipopolysaccharide/colanic/teichoic acid biosynthesis glycosyltransferase